MSPPWKWSAHTFGFGPVPYGVGYAMLNSSSNTSIHGPPDGFPTGWTLPALPGNDAMTAPVIVGERQGAGVGVRTRRELAVRYPALAKPV